MSQTIKAAYQGETGAFSEKAALKYFAQPVEAIPCPSFPDVFAAVTAGRVDFGMIPIENTLAGSVHPNYDLLLEYDVQIVGEIKLRVVHNLIAHPGIAIDDIKVIYAHPQAAMQCDQFLRRRATWNVTLSYDTAGSVKYIKEHRIMDGAAIASQEAAEKFGMAILQAGIESSSLNYTRFIVLSKRAMAVPDANKFSILFNTRNEPGALAKVLAVLAEQGINLTKLESRPIVGQPWEYLFYADCEADLLEKRIQRLVERIQSATTYFKLLGCYRRGREVP